MVKKSFWTGFVVGIALCLTLAVPPLMNMLFVNVDSPDIALNQVEVSNLNGDRVKLGTYVGKPLVVNYWATWCTPCIEEFPYFQEAKETYEGVVNFVMISDEKVDKITSFSTSHPYTFNYLISDKSLSDRGIDAIPSIYFYNSQGALVTKHVGSLTKQRLQELIEQIRN